LLRILSAPVPPLIESIANLLTRGTSPRQ